MQYKKILIIAPHMDDEVLGCGGVISKHKDMGDKVWVIFIAHRVYDHRFDKKKNIIQEKYVLKAKSILKYDKAIFLNLNDERLDASIQDIIMPLEKRVEAIKPETVYLPFRADNNQDHRAVFEAARVVFRPLATSFINNIYMYEVPSSTDQSPPVQEFAFLPNYYADITKYIDRKIEAYRCYKTEKRNYPHPRSGKALKVLAQKRGTEIGFKYAEAFMVLRGKWS